MSMPMVADFGLRLAGGLAGMLLLASWRVVPSAFFRTHCLVMLGLLSLAALFLGRSVPGPVLGGTIAAAALAYAGSAAWGLGLPRVAGPLTAAVAALAAGASGLGVVGRAGGIYPRGFRPPVRRQARLGRLDGGDPHGDALGAPLFDRPRQCRSPR